ncbi:MAG: I78 family peptidase inhibitor [Pseudomonadota bacterium]
MSGKSFLIGASVAAAALLAACAPPPPFEEVTDPFAPLPPAAPVSSEPLATPGTISEEVVQGQDPVITPADGSAPPQPDGTASETVTQVTPGGLVERLPDTCMLENYQQYMGTDGLIAVGLVTDRTARLVAPGDIVSQVYDPQRVNFYTDANGRVARISCG